MFESGTDALYSFSVRFSVYRSFSSSRKSNLPPLDETMRFAQGDTFKSEIYRLSYPYHMTGRHFKDSKCSSYVTKTRLSYWHYVLLLAGFLFVFAQMPAYLNKIYCYANSIVSLSEYSLFSFWLRVVLTYVSLLGYSRLALIC